ncbi:molybdopterin-binding protein [Seminibacterium arietis]|uniref:Molybdopterin-binding protein n=1 Tax=Seminibacterium arietis TaxID=1173502 RepID=A0ABW3I9X8_9PAST
MTISARNQLSATVKSIKKGVSNDVIELLLGDSQTLYSVITSESTQNLELAIGKSVFAIFKAPSVILTTDTDLILSSRNQLQGEVVQIIEGAVNAEVIVKTQGNVEIAAIITEASLKSLALQVGTKVTAMIKASSVIIGAKKAH